MQIYGRDPSVSIGGVIIDTTGCVAAGGVLGDLAASVLKATAALCLAHCFQNVKKLAQTFFVRAEGIEFRKSGADKPGLGGQVSRQPHGAHTTAVWCQFDIMAKVVVWRARRQVHEVAQLQQLVITWRIVG